jgi:hypothetical protein
MGLNVFASAAAGQGQVQQAMVEPSELDLPPQLEATPAPTDRGQRDAITDPAATLDYLELLPTGPLPAADDADAARRYVAHIAAATAAQLPIKRAERTDPQQRLLEQLAQDHVDVLLEAERTYPVLRYYLQPLIADEQARRRGPDTDALAALHLPHGATAAQARRYLRQIARISDHQHRVSPSDPQYAMLDALAGSHMPLVIEAMGDPRLSFWAERVVDQRIDASHRELVLGSLLDQPGLIGVVDDRGWALDALPTLVRGLEQGVPGVGRRWFAVLAELQDPVSYPALRLHLLRVGGDRRYHQLLADLPGIDLRPTLLAAWHQPQTQDVPRRRLALAELLLDTGDPTALQHLASLLPADPSGYDMQDTRLLQLLQRRLPVSVRPEGVRDWIDAHADRLRFDDQLERFFVADGWS